MTDWPDIPEADAIRAAEYTLGLTSLGERRAFEARLAAEPALRAEVLAWDSVLVPMAGEVAPVAPPARLWSGLESRLFGAARRAGLLGRLAFWRALSGAALAGLAGLLVLLVAEVPLGPLAPGPVEQTYVVEITGPDSELRFAALVEPEGDTLRFNRAAGEAPPDRVLELWILPEGASSPTSLGLLPTDRRGRIEVPPELAAEIPDSLLEVSVEPPGGSPTGAPTGPVLGAGSITPL